MLTVLEQSPVCLAYMACTLVLDRIADRGRIGVTAVCQAGILAECLRLRAQLSAARTG